MTEYLLCTYQQLLLFSFLNEPVFEQGSRVFPDLKGDLSAVPENSGCPVSEYEDVKCVSITKTLVASLSPSAGGTMSLDEGSIGPLS